MNNKFYKNMLIQGIFACYTLSEFKNMLIAMKTYLRFQNPTIFMKNAKNRKMNNFGNSC